MPETSATARNALVAVAVVVVGAALRWMAPVVTPLLLAMFLMVMVDGFARVLRRRAPALPGRAAVAAAILLGALAFGLSVWIVVSYAGDFIDQISAYADKLTGLMARISGDLGLPAPENLGALFDRLDPTQYLGAVAQALQDFVSSAVLVLIYLGFILASRGAFERKFVRLFQARDGRHEALQVFVHVRDSVEQYLWIQTVTGLMIAAASWGLMAAVGLQNAFFWAFLIFLVNYVPIVGAAAGILLPALFALLQFDGYGEAGALLGGLWLVTFVVGNVVLPRMQGRSFNMDPVVVLLSLAFWGAIWGLPGMFLSTPLTVLAMVVLAQFDGSRWIAVLLSADGDLDRWRSAARTPVITQA
ncbi:MAG TPA: AI-2E family transporter [Caulobacteraceae bacterium]|nr:AI-2E family transporter [Caulobacteraceae bacterium]